jgi:tRNA(fMet)-specific endonuclease VapC
MTNGELLLDTNIVVASFRDDPAARRAILEAERILVPVIVIGELLVGALEGGQPERERARIGSLLLASEVLGCDLKTAEHYAEVKDDLRRRGRPIPENDLWIAALARQHGLTVASRDHHFDGIEGVRREACLS